MRKWNNKVDDMRGENVKVGMRRGKELDGMVILEKKDES